MNNLDYADAYLAKFNFGKVANVLLSSAIDLTPEEASLLGVNKTGGDFTIDAVFGAISELTDNQLAKGKYSKVVKKIFKQFKDNALNEINKEVKNVEESTNNDNDGFKFDNSPEILQMDGNENYIPKECIDCGE